MKLVVACLLGLAATASANGRPEGTSSIVFRQGNENDIIAGLTFGAAISHDHGATWHWFCEDAIGYSGRYDPFYSYTRSGKIFATTFNGLRENSNGCTFDATPLGNAFVSSTVLGPDGTFYVGTDDPADGAIHASTDDGATFPAMTMPGQLNDWWESIAVAPSDPRRMYLSGYRYVASDAPDGGEAIKQLLLFASDDAGATWTPLPTRTLLFHQLATIDIAAISPRDPDQVYARIINAHGVEGDLMLRSTDGGQTWTKIFERRTDVALLVRANGDLVVGTRNLGAEVSHDRGDTWEHLRTPPHINCLVETAEGEVWACTRNYSKTTAYYDGFGIMRTTDLVHWTGLLHYQDIQAPVACAAGTLERDKCEAKLWCGLKSQLGITSTEIDCAPKMSPAQPDATEVTQPPHGCCDVGRDAAPGTLALGALVGMLVRRRRC